MRPGVILYATIFVDCRRAPLGSLVLEPYVGSNPSGYVIKNFFWPITRMIYHRLSAYNMTFICQTAHTLSSMALKTFTYRDISGRGDIDFLPDFWCFQELF